MAAAATLTVLEDGDRNLVVLVNITGTSGDLSGSTLIDRSAYAPAGTKTRVDRIEGAFNGFSASLLFDADTDLTFVHLPADDFCHNWKDSGGVSSNKAGAGANGDILITTVGFTGSGDAGTFTLHMVKG